MAIYVGQSVSVVSQPKDPLRNNVVVADAVANVEFYAPGKDPKNNPDDRTPDRGPYLMAYDEDATFKGTTGAYVKSLTTDEWDPGRWTVRVVYSGSLDLWEYGTFTLKQ